MTPYVGLRVSDPSYLRNQGLLRLCSGASGLLRVLMQMQLLCQSGFVGQVTTFEDDLLVDTRCSIELNRAEKGL